MRAIGSRIGSPRRQSTTGFERRSDTSGSTRTFPRRFATSCSPRERRLAGQHRRTAGVIDARFATSRSRHHLRCIGRALASSTHLSATAARTMPVMSDPAIGRLGPINGRAGTVSVTLTDLSFRQTSGGKRFAYPDFGSDFIDALHKVLVGPRYRGWRWSPVCPWCETSLDDIAPERVVLATDVVLARISRRSISTWRCRDESVRAVSDRW